MSLGLHNLLQTIPDVLLAVWFFRTTEHKRTPAYWQAILALAALASTVALHLSIISNIFPLRFLYRAICYGIYLYLWFGITWKQSAYYALFTAACWTACQNILFTPFLFPIARASVNAAMNPIVNEIFFTVLRILIMAIPLTAVSLFIPFRDITGPRLPQWVVLFFVIVCEMYVKSTLDTVTKEAEIHPLEISLFPIFLQLFLLGFLIFFEKNLYSSQKQKEIQLQEIANHYRIQNLEARQKGEMDIRRIHHDMKNHLVAINSLAQQNQASDSINAYISNLLNGMQQYETQVKTGNLLLDGLIAQKLGEAKQQQIAMSLIVDFTDINFLEDMDICTLFGNALDNAIEACAHVADSRERLICVRTQESAGQLFVTIANTYQGQLKLSNGLPETLKDDSRSHGIGLRNIRHVLKKYGGLLDINLEQPGWFRLTMLIPVRDASQTT